MSSIQIFDLSRSADWDSTVKSFSNYDVYYLSGYVKAFHIHGDGDPFLIYYEGEKLRAIYVYMKRNTAIEGYYDSITPYGYGGVLFEGNTSDECVQTFWKAFSAKMKEQGIVDNFVRYHPVLQNAEPMKTIANVTDLGKTVALDLSSPDVIWENIISKNRNMIRKAERNGITIEHGKGMDLLTQFMEIYNATMDKDHAENYYYFKRSFYESVDRDLQDNYEMFYAMYEGHPIAMSIMLYANGRLSYHLSGSNFEFRNLAPSNLLLYKAALWGYEQGCKTFHLGGGVGSGEDSLYKFKAAFNRNSNYQFSIGKEIYCTDKYEELIMKRKETDKSFNLSSSFFPLYRNTDSVEIERGGVKFKLNINACQLRAFGASHPHVERRAAA